MVWKYVANAVRLAEIDDSGTISHLEDLWTKTGAGPFSLDPDGVAGVWGTTTSTVHVEDSLGDWVFVFHNNWKQLEWSLKDSSLLHPEIHQSNYAVDEVAGHWANQLRADGPPGDLASTTASVEKYLQFQRAELAKFQDGLNHASTDLEAGLGLYDTMPTAYPFVATSIPYLMERVTGWPFYYIDDYRVGTSGGRPGLPTSGGITVSFVPVQGIEEYCDFYIGYRDPTVIQAPKSSKVFPWLMIAKRVRVFADNANVTSINDADLFDKSLGAATSISDVVLFKSNNPSFHHDGGALVVKGPYLLVDSLESVMENQLFRTSNRVPSAVFDEPSNDLYVYYVVESSVRDDGISTDYSFEAGFEGVSVSQLASMQNAWAAGSYADNGRGIAAKKISYADLDAEVLSVDPTDAITWTKASAVTGDLLGLVRIWVPGRGASSFSGKPVRLWDDRFGASTATGVNITPVKADPLPVQVQGGDIRLFFACFARPSDPRAGVDQITPTNGWGIWQAASIPTGVRLFQTTDPMTSSMSFKAVYGKDFVVRPETGGSWPDMVAESDVVSADDKRKYMDPDVFILPGTSAAVTFTVGMLAGCERYEFDDLTKTYYDFGAGPLGRFEGDMADLTWPWSDAI